MTAIMNSIKDMRLQIKKYIETADARVVKMIHAMLEVDADSGWWDILPEKVKKNVDAAMEESEKGEVIPHREIQKRYKKWAWKWDEEN